MTSFITFSYSRYSFLPFYIIFSSRKILPVQLRVTCFLFNLCVSGLVLRVPVDNLSQMHSVMRKGRLRQRK